MLIANLCLAFAPALPLQDNTPPPLREVTAAEIDAVFAAIDGTDRPGAAVAVIQDGQLIHARGYGMANLEYNIAITADSVFRIGSISKQFTAACILLAQANGKLSLDDEVRRFVPELPSYGKYARAPTIRDLMHHTSGIRDYLSLMTLRGMDDADYYTPADALALLAQQTDLDFAPGADFSYSNSGYFLLGVILERATGQILREFAAERIFEPLGMHATFFCDDTTELVPRRAEGYVPLGRNPVDGYSIGRTSLDLVGDGSVFSTVSDLALWDANFEHHKVGGDALFREQSKHAKLDNGEQLEYTAGLFIDEYKGHERVSHGGAFLGFRAELVRLPDLGLSVICLSNSDAGRPTKWCMQVADLFLVPTEEPSLPDGRAPRPRAEEHPELSKHLEGVAGAYASVDLGTSVRLEVDDDGLYYRVGHVEIGPLRLSEDGSQTFGGRPRLIFTRDESGRVVSFVLSDGRAGGLTFTRQAE